MQKNTGIKIDNLVLFHTISSGILNGGINFAIATAMYKNSEKITLWEIRHNSIAGDLGINILIQSTLTWLIVGLIVRNQLKEVDSFSFKPWPCLKNGLALSALVQGDFDFVSQPSSTRLSRFMSSLNRGFVFSLFMFSMFWPPTIVFLVVTYGNSSIGNWPSIQILKGTFAFILGCVSTAICCLIAIAEAAKGQEQSTQISEMQI